MKFILAFFLLIGVTVLTNAQQITLTGTVYDERGESIEKASVKLVSNSQKEFITTTNDKGFFEVKLPLGTYKISFASKGFRSLSMNNYKVVNTKSQRLYLDAVLEVGRLGPE